MDLDPSKEDEKLSGSYYLGGRKVEGLDVGDLIVCMGKTRRIRLNAALHPAARFPSPALALTTDLFFLDGCTAVARWCVGDESRYLSGRLCQGAGGPRQNPGGEEEYRQPNLRF